MGTFQRKPIVKFNSLTDTGLDKLSVGSIITYNDATNNNAIIEILNLSNITNTSTLTDFLGTAADYKSIAKDIVGAPQFTALTDTPATYVAGKLLIVNAAGTAVEFTDLVQPNLIALEGAQLEGALRRGGIEAGNYAPAGNYSVDLSRATSQGKGASGSNSFATGRNTAAPGTHSSAMGYKTNSSGTNSFSIGSSTSATGTTSLSTGDSTTALGQNSASFGDHTISKGENSVAIGKLNVGVLSTNLFEIGNGTSLSNRINVFEVANSGVVTVSGDIGLITQPKHLVTKEYVDAITGIDVTPTQGLISVTENSKTGFSLSGRNADNYGDIGTGAVDLSRSLEANTTLGATGDYSFTAGNGNTASGSVAVALGGSTTAIGNGATSLGGGTTALNDGALAFGLLNIGTDVNNILEIGNGVEGATPAESTKVNALEITKTGVIKSNAPVTEITDVKHVVTKEYVDAKGGLTANRPVDPVLYSQYWDTEINTAAGGLIVCTDNTNGANVWKTVTGGTPA